MNRSLGTWPPLVLTLLAMALRLHNLTYHSLWFDEAMSVHWARSSVPRILEVSMNLVEDRLPPLYYLSLHYWRLLVGDGEVAVRLPSVLLGTLLVPLVFRLASDLFRDQRVGVLSAVLVGLNPFLVWYSQEARMYAQAVLLAALGTWFFWRATARRRSTPGYWLAYGLCALAGLYTHLYTGFLLPAHALYLLLVQRRSRWVWMSFALTMLAVFALFFPLALATWRVSGEVGPGDPLTGLWERIWWLLSAFSVWRAPLSPVLREVITASVMALVVAGLGIPHKHASSPSVSSRPRILIALLLLTPFAIASLLLYRSQVAFFGERYFVILVPWLLIAVAAGAVKLADLLRSTPITTRSNSPVTRYLAPVVCYLLPITITLLPLPGQWSTPASKEAWRETVSYLADYARPEDAILIHPDWTRFPLQYYFRGPGQTYAVFGSVGVGVDVDNPLMSISKAHPVVWLVESHTELADPGHKVNEWLADRYPGVTELYPPGLVAVRAYAPGYLSNHLPDFATRLSAAFDGGVILAGYAVPQTQAYATDHLFHPPSGWVHVTLYWTVKTPLSQDYEPFVNLIDDLGQVWGATLERSNDAFDFHPTSRWKPDQFVRSDFDVNLNPLAEPGRYMLVVGLRDVADAQVGLVDGSLQYPLTAVEVMR